VLIFGPADARTIAREIDEIEQGRPGPYLQTHIALARGEVRRLEGDFEKALRLTEQAMEGLRGLGIRVLEAAIAQHVALIHDSAGEPMAAVPALRRADAVLEELGERGIRSTIHAFLAWALATGGDVGAARAACDLADELTAPEDIVNFTITPRARARIALAEGDGERAEELVRTAIQHALRTDAVLEQAAGKLELAHVLAALGRPEEAQPEAREALTIYEAKGDRPGTARAHAVLDEL
jgi:ATP/maltotriose-dependent transcriptional regulator MalT